MQRSLSPVLAAWLASRRAVRVAVCGGLVVGCLWGCGSTPGTPSGALSASRATALRPAESSARPGQDGAPVSPPEGLAQVPDAVPRLEPIRQGGPNKPYEVLGTRYAPMTDDVPFTQSGRASWYGTKFHGRRTASGEAYSMYGMTAAHKTLPIPSYIRVRERQTGKTVVVRVNDRGPFHSDRILDLSYTAALKLGLLGKGSGEVDIERITLDQIARGDVGTPVAQVTPVPRPDGLADDTDPIVALASRLEGPGPPAQSPSPSRAFTPDSKGFWVQLAAFSARQSLDAFQKKVAQDMSQLAPLMAVYQEGPLWRLQVGPYSARSEAQSVALKVREALSLVPVVVERR